MRKLIYKALVELNHAIGSEFSRVGYKASVNLQAFDLALYKLGLLDYHLELEFRKEFHGKRMNGGEAFATFLRIYQEYWWWAPDNPDIT